MIYREHYIKPIREFYDSDLIKIITGIRRCGKSVILEQIMQEISEKSDNIIYMNFEDKRISANISDGNALINYVENHHKEGKCYLFFDEIQVLDGWQDACKTLRLYDFSLFITGSNSKLLSGEFAKIFPFPIILFGAAFQSALNLDCFGLTHNLENIIYNELIYMGYTIWVYDNAGKEIDFLAQHGSKNNSFPQTNPPGICQGDHYINEKD